MDACPETKSGKKMIVILIPSLPVWRRASDWRTWHAKNHETNTHVLQAAGTSVPIHRVAHHGLPRGPFVTMIVGGIFWRVLSDTLGRKNYELLRIIGHICLFLSGSEAAQADCQCHRFSSTP